VALCNTRKGNSVLAFDMLAWTIYISFLAGAVVAHAKGVSVQAARIHRNVGGEAGCVTW